MEAGPPNVVREAMRPFWSLALFAALTGTVGGLAAAWLLATVNQGLTGANDGIWSLLGSFVGLGVVSVGGALDGTAQDELHKHARHRSSGCRSQARRLAPTGWPALQL
ncbi:hypothetical protein [Bradyrhizobium sp. dw_78]|uniref:hypothetical protein n=1 Tax=Bradyrhizobium sp. dw_78 TaxID=2719793 RepID=UPI001BD22C4A|nr:hypothetical protein [Bradyrhizobium sp. dw_78]